ncbi:MAG: PAS domain S-box protein [Planctomycetota bacterium]
MRRPEKAEKTPIEENKSLRSQKAKVVPVRRDPSARKTDKEALRRSIEYWQHTFDAINDAICILNSEGKILQCNTAMSKLTSKSASEVTGHSPCQFIHKKPYRFEGCPWLCIQKTHRRETQELQVEDKWFQITVDPILDADQKLIAAVHIVSDITEHKEAEQALRDSKFKYQSLFENMLNGFAYCKILLDDNGRPIDFVYLDINNAFEKLTGLKKENVLGKKVTEAIPGIKDLHPELFDIYGKVALTAQETRFDIFFQPLKIWLSISVYSPQKGYFAAVFENITERKRVEERLIRLSKVQKTITSVNQDIFLIKDRCELLEKACERIVEYAYKLVWIGFCDEKTKQVIPAAQAGFEEGYLDSIKITYDDTEYGKGPTGTAIRTKKTNVMRFIATDPRYEPWCEKALKRGYRSSAAIPIFGADKVIGALNVYSGKEDAFDDEEVKLLEELAYAIAIGLRAIDEEAGRKQAEEAQWESEEKFHSLALNIPGMIYRRKTNWSVEMILNSQMICGYSSEEFGENKVNWLSLIHPDDRSWVLEESSKLQEQPMDVVQEYRIITKDGKTRWVSDHKVSIFKEDGSFTGVDGIVYDITDRKKTEQRIQHYQKQLKSLTTQLLFTEDRERRRIAAGLHDNVSQKLALAKFELQSSMRLTSDTEMSASLNNVCKEIDNIIEDICSLTFELADPVLHELGLAAAIEKYLTEEIQEKHGIRVEINGVKVSNLEEAVRTCLYRSIRELLINVVKHAQAHKVKVRIYQSGDNIHICVEDDGVGLDAAEITLLPSKTAGFGLFSIKEQLEYIGGNLQIESKAGQGTKFTITTPLKSKEQIPARGRL